MHPFNKSKVRIAELIQDLDGLTDMFDSNYRAFLLHEL